MSSSSEQQKKLFLIGPGFIGGSLLVKLRQARPDLHLTALTRREEQAKELQSLGVETIIGGLNDSEIIQKAVEESDIVIHSATADDIPSTLAVVKGIKERKNKEKKIIYIQTSGNDELLHSAKQLTGKSIKERTLSDVQGDEVLENGRILSDAMHRQVDGPLREQLFNNANEKQFNASTTIIMPPLIYGIGSEPWKRVSIQIPMLATAMLKNGLATLPEDCKGVWNAVWVHDLVDAYLALLKELEQHTPGQEHPSHYLFPAEEKPFLWKDVFDAVVKVLKKNGVQGDEVKVIKDQKSLETFIQSASPEYAPAFGSLVFEEDSSYTRPDRLTKLGFKHSGKGPVDSILNGGELDQFVKEKLRN